jgi:hypothetical protein
MHCLRAGGPSTRRSSRMPLSFCPSSANCHARIPVAITGTVEIADQQVIVGRDPSSRRFVPLLQRRLADTCDYSLRPENFFAGSSSRLSLLKNVSGLGLGSPMKIATERSSCQEHRVRDAEWQVRCHEGQREEYPVNACHVHYSFIYSGGCSEQSGCNDDTTACGSARMCAAATARHRTSAPCCSIAPVGAVVIRTAAIPIPAIKVGIATIKSEASISEAAAISEAAFESEAASESAVKPESATAETTSVEAAAAETTSMTAKAAAAARECFVVRGHQSSDDKRGNERRRDFASHNACSVSLDGCGKNEDLLPR